MIAKIKQLLRGWVLTAAERELLAPDRKAAFRLKLLRNLLRWDQVLVIQAMDTPDRWRADEPLTPAEAEGWAQVLMSPAGLKIDIAMINLAQQQAQQAIHAPVAEIERMAGYAAGYRAAWQVAKSLSTMAGPDAGKPEGDADTGAHVLAHLHP